METQAQRAAKNEALFREVNERIAEVTAGQDEEVADALCECSDASCAEMIQISLAEYQALRARGERLALIAGHEDPAVERVVERNDRFIVVEKTGEGAEIARELDPRA